MRDQPARHLRGVRARAHAHDDLGRQVRAHLEQPVRAHPRDPAVVLQRAHDARDPEADLAAVGDLRRQHRAGAQAERVGHPEPDLDLVRPANPPPLGERRVLELRVVAGVGDEAHRLAEPERVRRVDAVALADRVHTRHSARLVESFRVERHRELVALADRPGVLAQALEQRGQREHQRDHARADRDRGHGREPAAARGGGEAHAEREQPAAFDRAASAAVVRARSPPRRISTGGRRAARQAGQVAAVTTTSTTASQRDQQRRGERDARAELVQRGEQVGGRPRHDERAERDAERGRGDGDDGGLDGLLRGDPAGAEAERALHAEAGQAALDLGVRARGEHRPRGHQRHERERDEQRDHDPRGLREQDLHARAGDELQLAEPEGDRAGLGERDVGLRRVVEPQQRDVRPHPAVAARGR